MNLNNLGDLKEIVGKYIKDSENQSFPKVLTYNRGIDSPKYRITIEEIEEDFFVDSRGVKWIKAKKEEDLDNSVSFKK